MSLATLSDIHVYPVKSVGGISLSNAWVERQGLTFDRRFMLALSDGSMVTARKYPQMVTIRSMLMPDGLMFTAPGKAALSLRYTDFKRQEANATVWKDTFTAYTTTDDANDWFSDFLGVNVELLFCGEQSNRYREKVGNNVSFADGYPLLIISQASLDELNRRSSEVHCMDQFRTNLVASGTEPFAEDSWKRIRIGEVEFEAVKPCERCILTTVDVVKGDFRANKEPLRSLSQFRANEKGGVFFGQNLVAKNEGRISAGDVIEVLEYKDKEVYEDHGRSGISLRCVEREEMARDFITFWFEPCCGLVPSYLPGQYLPIELELNGQSIVRYYTLSSSPSRPDRLAISVKRIDGGVVSNWLVEHLHEGDKLSAQMPTGAFHLEEHNEQPLLLLSAGSGVTPMLSMLRYLVDSGNQTDVVFYHQCRSIEDIPCRAELEQLNHDHDWLSVRLCLTQAPMDWFGLKGRLSLSHLKQIRDVDQRKVYMCGPDGFMQKARNLLQKQGVAEADIYQEAFGVTTSSSEPFATVEVEIDGVAFKGDNQHTLLEQAENAGVPVANSCRAGFCGACKVKLLEGEVTQSDSAALFDDEREEGMVLACCCVPKTDVKVIS